MEYTFHEIEQAALSLPDTEKTQLVDRLNESLADSSTDPSIIEAWGKLALSRLERVRSGVVETIDGPTGLRAVRERVRG